MTVTATAGLRLRSLRGYINQALMVLLINIPTISFGLAMGWVSLASGESGRTSDVTVVVSTDVTVVVSAAGTFAAGLLGAPFCARALAYGRRRTMAATTVAMALCWALKLCGGGWWVIAARVSAGLGGAGAWCVAPLVAREMCSERVRGAAAASLVVAHNLGLLLMYIAAEARIQHTTVLVCCLVLSLIPCVALVFVPESPAFLAASGRKKEAMAALAWLRGRGACDPSLDIEVAALPAADIPQAQVPLIREMLSCPRRRRAFTISLLAILGQEVCGVLALLQFAERSFILARGGSSEGAEGGAAARAVLLGAGQLAASVMALYLVERVGRKPLLVTTALLVALCLGAGAVLISRGAGGGWLPAAALAAAVAADSAGLQPVPYAMAVEMFHYQYRSCVMMLATTFSNLANVVEIVVFPTVVYFGGISAALALASTITFIYALLAFKYVPETKGRTPEQIYDAICGMQITDGASVDAVCGKRIRDGASVKVDCSVTIDGAVPNVNCGSETVITKL